MSKPCNIQKEIYSHCLASVKHSTKHDLCQQLELEQLDMFSDATVSYTQVIRSYYRIAYKVVQI
jgi:hypothetical protein